MFSLFKQPKFPTALFVIASLLTLILIPFFFVIIKMTLTTAADTDEIKNPDKYFLKKYEKNDPLVTKIPDLKDILRGPIISENDPSLGSSNARVTIVEYSDFTCAFCQKQEEVLKKVVNEYKDKVRLIWKDYPEKNISSVSWQASQAARCAGEQNKFWEFHDLIFKNSPANKTDLFRLADDLKLDGNKFKDCMDSGRTKKAIKDNIDEANALNITGVPFVYVNDEEVMGEVSYEEMKGMIENKLK